MDRVKKAFASKKQQSLKNLENWKNTLTRKKTAETEDLTEQQISYESIDEMMEKERSDSYVEHHCKAVKIYQPISNDVNFDPSTHNWNNHPYVEIKLHP